MRDYLQLLNDLKDGSIKELKITAEEFQDFQSRFMEFPERKQVIGKADRGGVVVYHFERIKDK
ncbi:hypothetical protein ITQ84_08190 [Pediococcus pentosaceus]|uniref:hypothetical protein n=1 Tax=Pediococcus pentosaceus TaxID=1255 RepID=UPI0013303605|nr:hypothetical protein [Pediococcus pentosaceus]KAF0507061.1 hypothetical protein GBP24_03835 [Pediococcus pentosaceus]MBF7140339.1 hypothetical protein [Pediococcus pentosaceus]MCM6819441.1 hypothetical protein [Pediococcus pentosaceus]UQB01359.1 hypothetical protein Ped0941_03430 [Pediococcus pentosaceus]UQB03210.1 hypothetical protein Ped0620_03430 [Pediococcus pentosaceus]